MVPARLLAASFLAICFIGLLPDAEPLAGQAAKDKKAKGGLIAPDKLEIKPGDPLSIRTPVARPAAIKGVKSWTVETKRHRWSAFAVAVSPDGMTAATGGYDGIIRLWDVATGKFLKALVGHGSYVYGLAWSPDGSALASSGSHDATVRIWDPATGMPLRVLKGHKGYTSTLAWSPDGGELAVSGGTSGFVTFWNPAQNKQLHTLEHGTPVYHVAWSPDGKSVACAVTSGAFVWDASSHENLASIKPDGTLCYSVAYSPDAKQLLVGGKTMCEVWDLGEMKKVDTVTGQGYSVAWPKEGNYIAIAPASGNVQMLDAKSFKPQKPLGFSATKLAATDNGKTLIGLSPEKLQVYDVAESKAGEPINVTASGSSMWVPGKPVITGFGGKSLSLWDTASGKPLKTLEGHTAGVLTSQWSRDGRFLATGSADKTARVWDALSGELLRTLEGHEAAVNALAWSPDGRLATGSADKMVRVFAPGAEKPAQTLSGHTHPITALAWSRDGKVFASGSADRNITLWNLETGKPLRTWSADHDIQTIALSPDGRLIASGGADDVVRVFALATGKLVVKFDTGGSPPNVASLAWSPDGTLLAVGKSNHTLQVISLKAEKAVMNVTAMAPVTNVAWTLDGKTVASCSIDRSLRFWDPATGALRATLIANDKQIMAIGAEGHYRVPAEADSELVYVVQTDKGQETLEPKAFAAKYGWRNNPAGVRLAGN